MLFIISKKKPLIANACNGLIYEESNFKFNCKKTSEIFAIIA